MASRVTNVRLGEMLGISHAQVSRLRSGHRPATLNTLISVRDALGWSVEEQVAAFEAGNYAAEFEKAIQEYGGRQTASVV